jgi:O-antigen ligase
LYRTNLKALIHKSNFLSILVLLCICICFFYLYFPIAYFKGFNGKRQLQVLIIISIHLLLFSPIIRDKLIDAFRALGADIKFYLASFFISGAISASLAQFSLYAWMDFFQVFLLCNSFFILSTAFHLYPLFKKVLFFIICLGFICLLVEFFIKSIIGLSLQGALDLKLIYPDFGNYRFLNQAQVQLVFILSFLYIALPKPYHKYVFVLSVVNIFMLLNSGARGALLSLTLVLLLAVFFSNKVLKKLVFNTLKVFVVGLLLYLFYTLYESYYLILDSYLIRSGSSGRLSMWLEAIRIIAENPLGIGPYHYGVMNNVNDLSHPHNSVLRFVLEWGWIAGAAVFILAIKLFIYLIEVFRNESSIFRLSLTCSLLAGGAYSLFGGLFIMPASQMTFVLLLAFFFSDKYNSSSDDDINSKSHSVFKRTQISILFLSACSVATLVYVFFSYESYLRYLSVKSFQSVTIEVTSSDAKLTVKPATSPPITTGPRMWVYGGIVDQSKN